MRAFEILTLSDHTLGKYKGLADPITIISGTIGFLTSMFPNIWGGRSREQIQADEMASMLFHQAAFLREHNIQLPQSVVVAVLRPGWDLGENGSQLWQRIIVRFYNENREALLNAGKTPYGTAPGGIFTPYGNLTAYLPYLVGGIALILILKRKK